MDKKEYGETTFFDFRDPIAVSTANEIGDVRCRLYGNLSAVCQVTRAIASDVNQAHVCFMNWTPNCTGIVNKLKNQYNVDFSRQCNAGWYSTNPFMNKFICTQDLNPQIAEAETMCGFEDKKKVTDNIITKKLEDENKDKTYTVLKYIVISFVVLIVLYLSKMVLFT
jgi:hypothetical protein